MRLLAFCFALLPLAAMAADPPGGQFLRERSDMHVSQDRLKKACLNAAALTHRAPSDITTGDVDQACTCISDVYTARLEKYPAFLRKTIVQHQGQEVMIPSLPYAASYELSKSDPARVAIVDASYQYKDCDTHIRYGLPKLYDGGWQRDASPLVSMKKGPARNPPPSVRAR